MTFAVLLWWEKRKLAVSEWWCMVQHRRRCSPRKPTLLPEDHGDRIAYRCALCRCIVEVDVR